jgi:hypothetical protein
MSFRSRYARVARLTNNRSRATETGGREELAAQTVTHLSRNDQGEVTPWVGLEPTTNGLTEIL